MSQVVRYAVVKKNYNIEMINFSYLDPKNVTLQMVIEHLAPNADDNIKLIVNGKIEIDDLSPILHEFNYKRGEITEKAKAELAAWLEARLA